MENSSSELQSPVLSAAPRFLRFICTLRLLPMDCAWTVALDRPADEKKLVKRAARCGGGAMRVLRDRKLSV